MKNNIFTEEGRTRFRNFKVRLRGYLAASLIIGAAAGYLFYAKVTWPGFAPLQKIYLYPYAVASLKSWLLTDSENTYTVLGCDVGGGRVGFINDDQVYVVRDDQGHAQKDRDGYFIFKPYEGVKLPAYYWGKHGFKDIGAEQAFRTRIYKEQSLPRLYLPAFSVGLLIMVAGVVLAVVVDQRVNRRYEAGRRVRGSRLIEPKRYGRQVKGADGLTLHVGSMTPDGKITRLVRWISGEGEPVYELRMRRSEEAQGMLILGDIGSGKSQILHRLLYQIAMRNDETVIIYDPAGEFVKSHYSAKRGDLIVNPLDVRSPFWSPALECTSKPDSLTVADSFFPGRERAGGPDQFFTRAARDIFARLLEFRPDPGQLVTWLGDEAEIDRKVSGTELAHYIAGKAANQRAGVLGTLAKVGTTLRMLPEARACQSTFSLTAWAQKRQGWIFLTSTKETEERLRPLYAAYLDLLMRRLLSVDDAAGRRRPVKLIVDEIHNLEYLPTFYKVIVEGRKFGVHVFQGAQNKSQYEARYGQDAPTMLSCPRHKIILRCSEPDSARWLSELLGDEENEKPRSGVTASVNDRRDSINYSSYDERRPVVSKEEIASLPDLCGYWTYGGLVVPFKFSHLEWNKRAERFIARPMEAPAPAPASAAAGEPGPKQESGEEDMELADEPKYSRGF